MTEAEWNACADVQRMFRFAHGKGSRRKHYLFHAALDRKMLHKQTDERRWNYMEVSERYADGLATEEELLEAETAVLEDNFGAGLAEDIRAKQDAYASVALRCIFGSLLFRPITLNPAWLTPTVQSLAQTIYADRAFDRLPILADALEESGCTSEDMLSHLRQPGVHTRGCWRLI